VAKKRLIMKARGDKSLLVCTMLRDFTRELYIAISEKHFAFTIPNDKRIQWTMLLFGCINAPFEYQRSMILHCV
jgi:hypothetical protein